ncbi:CPCC family cysteine-rich protein [Clostridium perfringens]|uniref:CPCC family cysteine-rich protein n=1 Tax=Clostridium perfringens TaxID=1502 RepID=UPI002A0D2C02|nr:CPCC family cysteine-rich protein [Clostridium perfringens]MDK0728084.1 CPCC family cysteine-rich protein [Clostridium perfringens]MDM0771295.1 CPCC family cysteine-rich protein [Clostridium perfringens]MDM0843226.1 CPCC family cysteine-rich protein [Clostridium perfringens]
MKCPVCGHEVDLFDICDYCNYQNSGPNESLDGPTGPNKMTLREAYKNSKEIKKALT